jgi:hypothetical protein
MKSRQHAFLSAVLEKTFNFSSLVKDLQYIIRQNETTIYKDIAKNALQPITDALIAEQGNTEKFRRQLSGLLATDQKLLLERLAKGCGYYRHLLHGKLKILLQHQFEMNHHKRVKTYLNQLTELDVNLSKKIEETDKAILLVQAILEGKENVDTSEIRKLLTNERTTIVNEIRKAMPEIPVKKGRKKKKKNGEASTMEEPSTHEVTIGMLKSGMTVAQICEQRKLVPSTIEGHLAKGVEAGLVEISTLASIEAVEEISHAIKSFSDQPSLSIVYQHFKGKYSYGILRAVTAHVHAMNKVQSV